MKLNKNKNLLWAVPMTLALSACGGGGGGSATTSTGDAKVETKVENNFIVVEAKASDLYTGNRELAVLSQENASQFINSIYGQAVQFIAPGFDRVGFPFPVQNGLKSAEYCIDGGFSMVVQQPTGGIGPATLTAENCSLKDMGEDTAVFNGVKQITYNEYGHNYETLAYAMVFNHYSYKNTYLVNHYSSTFDHGTVSVEKDTDSRTYLSNLLHQKGNSFSQDNISLTEDFKMVETLDEIGLKVYTVEGHYYDHLVGKISIKTLSPLRAVLGANERDVPELEQGSLEITGANGSKMLITADNYYVSYSLDQDGDGIFESQNVPHTISIFSY